MKKTIQEENDQSFIQYPANPINIHYQKSINIPMTVQLILERIKNDYYRSLMALQNDFRILLKNLRIFNHGNDMTRKNALIFSQKVLKFIQDKSKLVVVDDFNPVVEAEVSTPIH